MDNAAQALKLGYAYAVAAKGTKHTRYMDEEYNYIQRFLMRKFSVITTDTRSY